MVGDAGAPVDESEIKILQKAFNLLKDRLNSQAVETAQEEGVVKYNSEYGYEINTIGDKDCIFVEKDENGVAICAIQNAYYRGELNWEKPLSCHLYPIRLKRVSGVDFANFEYVPETCAAGCKKGDRQGIFLSDFLGKALKRRYGTDWYNKFSDTCEEIRNRNRQ